MYIFFIGETCVSEAYATCPKIHSRLSYLRYFSCLTVVGGCSKYPPVKETPGLNAALIHTSSVTFRSLLFMWYTKERLFCN